MTDMKLIIDPEFKTLIRRLSHEEYRGLEESILEEGCRDSLVVWGNTLVDGHHRYEICTKHNIPFNTVQREFASRSDAKIWIAKNQFAKRNLSYWDRCTLALSLEDAFREKAKENISAAVTRSNIERNSLNPSLTNWSKLDLDSGFNTRAEVAKIADVGEGTLVRAKVIIEKGMPEQITKLENREASIGKIYTEIKEKEKSEKAQLQKEAEPQKELPIVAETPALDQADKQDATEQTQQQSEPDKKSTDVQVAAEPNEPGEPGKPAEFSEPSKDPGEKPNPEKYPGEEPEPPEQETANVETTSEPAVSSQDESDSKSRLESNEIASQPQDEAQEQAETHDEGGEDTKAPRKTYEKMFGGGNEHSRDAVIAKLKQEEAQVKAELEQPIEEDKPVKEGEYPPDCYFYCLGCHESFKIGDNTKCPLCGSEKIVENDLLNKCDYKPKPKPLKKKLHFCPCGCGFGIDLVNIKWYGKEETS